MASPILIGLAPKEIPAPTMNSNDCLFCSSDIHTRMVAEEGEVFAIEDNYPVTRGHLLIITRRHVVDYFAISSEERHDAERLIEELRRKILEADQTVTGFNIGVNCGMSAGQTVMHAHIHLIPRRDGDLDDPRGGVRGVIPEKRIY